MESSVWYDADMAKKTTNKTEEREKYALWLDNSVLARLREYQNVVGVPVSVSIRKAIDAYLENLKAKR
jgi:Ribbon-helix-helix domain